LELDNKEDYAMTQNQNQSSAASKRISTYLTIIVLIVAGLAVIAIVIAAGVYASDPNDSTNVLTSGFFALIGIVALTMSLFTLYQSRRQTAEMKIDIPKVMTTIQCTNKNCDTKSVREFQRGDYVFKELDASCQKCSGRQMITAVYKEVKEKEKTFNV
jgi:hypothetical protein